MKLAYLAFVACVIIFCKGMADLPDDAAIYGLGFSFGLVLVVINRQSIRNALGHALLVFNITYWGCFFLLPERRWKVTASLVDVRALASLALMALEAVALLLLLKGYLKGRREKKLFPAEAFLSSLQQFPMHESMLKLFSVEFNIWAALVSQVFKREPFKAGTYASIGKVETGYHRAHVGCAITTAVAIGALGVYALPAYWWLIPIGVLLYLVLLLNCDAHTFAKNDIYVGHGDVVIPNGIHGMLRVPIASVLVVEGAPPNPSSVERLTLKICRFISPNVTISLKEPVHVFGAPFSAIQLNTATPEKLRSGIHVKSAN